MLPSVVCGNCQRAWTLVGSSRQCPVCRALLEGPEEAQVVDLDSDLVARIKGLKLEYKASPQPDLLVRIPNADQDVDYEVSTETKEFTSLCPLNLAQPDYARIAIVYSPGRWLVELKSLKFYLCSFRMVPIFHEQVPTTILRSLVSLLGPRSMDVVGEFTTRGGLDTRVSARYLEEVVR